MSFGLKTARYGIAAVVVAAIIIGASFLYLGDSGQLIGGTTGSSTGSTTRSTSGSTGGSSTGKTTTTSGIQGGAVSNLVIQLTDPPQVPDLTMSLNLTYTSLSLLVGEPSGHADEFNTTTLTITPGNGSATLNVLELQNVSVTLGAVSLPNDSIIYSVTFTVSSIKIDVNGKISTVSLAGGASTLTVTIASPHELSGTNVALLQLNPVVVQTPTGYQLIPSAVGVIRHSEGQGEEQTGSRHHLSENDTEALENVHGNVTGVLKALSVSGNSTTITVEVKNAGNGSVVLNAIGIHGNFTAIGNCGHGDGNDSHGCHEHDHTNDVVFVPINSTISGTACGNQTMQLVNGDNNDHEPGGLTLGAGQCVDLTYTGVMSFGESNQTLIPSTTAGQVYEVYVMASNGANLKLSCTLPLGPASCTVEPQGQQDENGHHDQD